MVFLETDDSNLLLGRLLKTYIYPEKVSWYRFEPSTFVLEKKYSLKLGRKTY